MPGWGDLEGPSGGVFTAWSCEEGEMVRSKSTADAVGVSNKDVLQYPMEFSIAGLEGYNTVGIRATQNLFSILEKPPFAGEFCRQIFYF